MTNRELSDYIKQARKIGQSEEEIKEELIKLAWKDKDIDEALNSAPKSLFRYKSEEGESVPSCSKKNFSLEAQFPGFLEIYRFQREIFNWCRIGYSFSFRRSRLLLYLFK